MQIAVLRFVFVLQTLLVGTHTHVLKQHVKESDLQKGHSWGHLPEHWDRHNDLVKQWKAWDKENKKLEREHVLHSDGMSSSLTSLKSIVLKRWPELPSQVSCSKNNDRTCQVQRKAHVKLSLTTSGLYVCRSCPDPHIQGSWFDIWPSHWIYPNYHIDADLVYSFPNDGSLPILNQDHIRDSVVMVKRGKVGLANLAKVFQDLGALALVIIDDGRCGEKDFVCDLGRRRAGEGFAALDAWWKWIGVVMPTFLVSRQDGSRLESMMPLIPIDYLDDIHLICEEDLLS
jgi:hypothetical protein